MNKKKMLKVLLSFMLFLSCGDKDNDVTREITLTLYPGELVFSPINDTKTIQVTSNATDITAEIDEINSEWCSATLQGNAILVTVKKNDAFSKRQATLTVSADEKTATANITQESNDFVSTVKRVPLGGNSFISTQGGSGSVGDSGFMGWNNEQTVFSTFFRLNQTGNLNLYLEYAVDADDNVIEATCNGETFTVTLPKPTAQADTIVFLGTTDITGAGYARVDFKGVKRNGNFFATPSMLYIHGEATTSVNRVDDFSYYWGRRGPSVHMSYTMPTGKNVEWFYNEITVPEGYDPVGSYFMSNGFGQGYFGIQVNSLTERRVLFSVWSPYSTDNPDNIPEQYRVKLADKGEGVITGEFGNEGSGGQSYLIYNWRAGNTYKFLTRIRPADDGYSEYTSYFFAPEEGVWRLIARFLRPETTTWYTNAHSFLENFSTDTGHITRKAAYNNQWAYTTDGEWVELTAGRFTVDDTGRAGARMDYRGGANDQGFFLQNCGFFNDYVSPDRSFNRTPGGIPPQIDFDAL